LNFIFPGKIIIKFKLGFFAVLGVPLLFYQSCSPGSSNVSRLSPGELIAAEDSLLAKRPQDSELKQALIKAHLNLARQGAQKEEYEKILLLDPNHRQARYFIVMHKGRALYNKGSANELWDAIILFSKAAAIIDTLGEPYYWMAKSYEKKDDMDFELVLEAYSKALNLHIPDSLAGPLQKDHQKIIKRKTVYDEFWK